MDNLAQKIYQTIEVDWRLWAANLNAEKFVIGISGGVDSTTCAAIACKIFGKDNVFGVSMPCDGQKDIDDVNLVFEILGIKRIDIDIGDMFAAVKQGLENNCINLSDQARVNAPARLRMTTLYAVSQSLGAYVINTCNRSETVVGNDTRWGDQCGDFAPIKNLTKSEVVELAKWLGIPDKLADKIPIDGLQPLTDEDRLGMRYCDIDNVIRGNTEKVPAEVQCKVRQAFKKNKFKIYGINVAGPTFCYLEDMFDIL